MTTIAYRDGVLAGDSCHAWCSQETDDYWVYKYATKLVRNGPVMFGCSGDCDSAEFVSMLMSLRKPTDLPSEKVRKAFEGSKALIVFTKPELAVYAIEDCEMDECGEYHAIGSGAKFAMTAFDMDANALKAVEMASRRDLFTRPPFHSLNVADLK